MDTPQVTPGLLAAAIEPLLSRTADATFGLAEDGGFWLLGLREVDPALILGVPMSQPDTVPAAGPAGTGWAPGPDAAEASTWTRTEAEHIASVTPGSRSRPHGRVARRVGSGAEAVAAVR